MLLGGFECNLPRPGFVKLNVGTQRVILDGKVREESKKKESKKREIRFRKG